MLDFRFIELEDRAWLQPLLEATGNIGSEYAFGTLMIWGGDYRVKVAQHEGQVFLSFGEKPHSYYFPLAYRDLTLAMSQLLADAAERGHDFRMWGLTKEHIDLIEAVMPERFDFSPDPSGFDYIYSTQELADLKGRKWEKKRNHLSRFRRTYSYTFNEVTASNLQECVAISEEWCKTAQGGKSVGMEYCALIKAAENYESLGLQGGLIRVDGKAVAFTIGERLNSSTFLLHFEKALPEYDGVYAVINQEFADRHLRNYQYVNREEDMGIAGLRKAKLSYHPVFLVEKHVAVLRKEVAQP